MDMKALAKQMKTKKLSPNRVVFEFGDKKWIFDSPTVMQADMMGNKMFQIIGDKKVMESVSEEDISLIMEKTDCSREEAISSLKKHGEVAEAIMALVEG